jgi:hypothetical protein
LGICLLAAVIGGPASVAGSGGPNTQVQRPRLAAFVAGSTPQTITFDQPQDTKAGEPVTLSASAAPGLEVSFTSNTSAVCTASGPTVTTTTAGVCVITASQDGDATYAAAPEVARSFQVTTGQAAQTITFTPPADTMAGVPVIQLGLSVVMRVHAMTAGISAGRLVALHSGRCDITATLAVQGINVLSRQAHLMLPGVIPLSPGIRLLAAGD